MSKKINLITKLSNKHTDNTLLTVLSSLRKIFHLLTHPLIIKIYRI